MKIQHIKLYTILFILSFSSILAAQNEVKNPLSQVSKYNINKDGTFINGDEKTAIGDYFSWDEAIYANTPEGYHVPSKDEAMVIFGEMAAWKTENKPPFPIFNTVHELQGNETVCIWGETKDYKAIYKGYADYKAYAIRFIGGDNKYLSAYRWEVMLTGEEIPDDFGPINGINSIKVTCRLLGDSGKDININNVADEKFWEKNNQNDVVRYIVAGGFMNEGLTENVYARGRYWTTSEWDNPQSNNSGYGFGCDSDWAYVTGWGKYSEFNIRVFKDSNTGTNQEDTTLNHELNPLGMFADYNLTINGEFATGDIKTTTGDYFTWENVQNAKTPEGFHIPSKNESIVLFGEMNMDLGKDQPPYVQFTDEIDYTASETVTIWGEEGKYKCHFKSYANDICYAIRFIGENNKYISAFRWELLPSGGSVNEQFGPIRNIYGVKVTCRLLGPSGKDIEISKIANEDYWENNNENDVIKYFPAAGFRITDDDEIESNGLRGRYWTISKKINEEAGNYSGFGFGFDENWAFAYAWAPYSAFSIRCIKDNPFITDGIDRSDKNLINKVSFSYNEKYLHADKMLSHIWIYTSDGTIIYDNHIKTDLYNVNLKNNLYIIRYIKNSDSTVYSSKLLIK